MRPPERWVMAGPLAGTARIVEGEFPDGANLTHVMDRQDDRRVIGSGVLMSSNDRQYFCRRAAQEQAAAEHAATDAVAAIHRRLAKRYLDLAGQPHLVEAVPEPAQSLL